MHIVLVCREFIGSVRGGGIGSYMAEIARAYVALGHKVTVVTASDDTRYEITYIKDGYTVKSLAGGDFFCHGVEPGSKFKKLRLLYRFHSYRKKLRTVIDSISDADIVEVADYGAEALYLLDLPVPVVIRLHTPLSLSISDLNRLKPHMGDFRRYFGLKAENRIFNKARYISSCSQSLLDWLKDNFELGANVIGVVKNPVTIKTTEEINPKQKELSIFYAGTISETKGVGDLVEACRILRRKGIDITLKLAGKGGSYCDNLKRELDIEGASWCEFLGKLPREEVYRNYIEARVCCFPSWWENMPMVVLEAMSMGALVVATDAGGTKEIIRDGETGFLVSRKSPLELSKIVEMALSMDEDQRRIIVSNAISEISENYNSQKIATEMLSFFEKVIKNNKKQI